MKIIYIVPNVNNEGGVARVLSVKTNYLIENFGYDVHILTQNNGNSPLFYEFNDKIKWEDISLKGNKIFFFFQYKKALQKAITKINPEIVMVCDNGLKAFLIPFILKTKIPIIFESHGSKYVQEAKPKHDFVSNILLTIQLKFKVFAVKRFTKLVALSDENLKEWNVKNGVVISNPLWFSIEKKAKLNNKKALVLARHSHEKGVDRLLLIWKKVVVKHPDWILEIYGKSDDKLNYKALTKSLKIDKNVNFFEPQKNSIDLYLDSSIYLMTSRSEGLPMVLIEAMALGLPCVTYDCPSGPRTIIKNNENGFLVEDDNENEFVEKLNLLVENENLRIEMGNKAKENSGRYNIDTIMLQWKNLFENVILK